MQPEIYKERNRRVFDQKVGSSPKVMQEIKREVKMACGGLKLPSLFRCLMFKFVSLEFECFIYYVISLKTTKMEEGHEAAT
jgi:hypothetical protein